jgi:hypothetical protein
MKDMTITIAFGTKLTAHQLNTAIRLGALLHGGEPEFYGKPGIDSCLWIKGSGLTRPFLAVYKHDSVVFDYAPEDSSMLACIREVLDEKLIIEATASPTGGIPIAYGGFGRASA